MHLSLFLSFAIPQFVPRLDYVFIMKLQSDKAMVKKNKKPDVQRRAHAHTHLYMNMRDNLFSPQWLTLSQTKLFLF